MDKGQTLFAKYGQPKSLCFRQSNYVFQENMFLFRLTKENIFRSGRFSQGKK